MRRMSSVTFDTLKYVKQLESAGIPPAQAEAFVNAQRDILSEALDTSLATKADIARLESRIDTMELRLTVKLGAFIAAAVGVLIAVLRMPH